MDFVLLQVLEDRLGTSLSNERSQLAESLSDGVHLCNFVNQIRPRSVPAVFTSTSKEVSF